MASPRRTAIVIGSGFAGLSAASFLARDGWKVKLFEKNAQPGGRASQLHKDGFTFDMGPSFYWMPDVFERYFQQFGKTVSDYYQLERLDPSYRIYWKDGHTDLSADYLSLRETFESIEAGAAEKLDEYLKGAEYKYDVGVRNLVYKPGLSLLEFMDWKTISGVFKLDVFRSMSKHIEKYFEHPKLKQIMEFPILFLGALPEETPALYSLMNYADIKGGTWYPKGGMYSVVKGMYKLAKELGVEFYFNEPVTSIQIINNKASGVMTVRNAYNADVVISGADYQFTEEQLLPRQLRSYSKSYWQKKVMAPSCLLYYVGLNKKLNAPVHHSLFFDVPFAGHGQEIYKNPSWPSDPLFYVSVSSTTDPATAPAGCENLVFLIPVASGLENDTETLRKQYFETIVKRMEQHLKEDIREHVISYSSYSVSNFISDYHSFKGNAYGLANTLRQTAIFRPSCKSKKVGNLYYTGQLTVPGPGVPPCIISGEVAATEVGKHFK